MDNSNFNEGNLEEALNVVEKMYDHPQCISDSAGKKVYHIRNQFSNFQGQQKRRGCDLQLAEFGTGELLIISTYDDGSCDIHTLILGVRGPWEAYKVNVRETDWVLSLFAIKFKGSGDWIVGKYDKLSPNYLYEKFLSACIHFKKIRPGNFKTALYEGLVGELEVTENNIEISAMQGWTGDMFQFRENFIWGSSNEVKGFPILQKSFAKMEYIDDAATEYFLEMKGIENEYFRLIIMEFPFLAMISSLLRRWGHPLNFGLNFVQIDEFDRSRICSWHQIFNRDCCIPISCAMSNSQLQKELQIVKDEVFLADCVIYDGETDYMKKTKKNIRRKMFRMILGDERLEGRLNEPIQAGISVISSDFMYGKNVCNIFITKEWYEKNESKFAEVYAMERILTDYNRYIEKNIDEVEEIVKRRRGCHDKRVEMIQIGLDILKAFWKRKGIDFLGEAGIDKKLCMEKVFEENSCDENEILEQFICSVRKVAKHYTFIPKKIGHKCMNALYFTEDWIWIPSGIFDEILKKGGLRDRKERILLVMKDNKVLLTDYEGFSKKLQIGGERFETYQIKKELFNKTGEIDIIALGGEGFVN